MTHLPADIAAAVAAVRARYDQCFACGLANPLGLHLDGFRFEDGGVAADFTPRPEYRGFEGVLHGGIVATALDEILAWAAMLGEDTFVLTGTLDLRYRRPAAVSSQYELRGRVDERRGRRLLLSGSMAADGTEIAAASGLYLATEPVGLGVAGGD